MSRRPRGPSDRPTFYYDIDDLESADAPRMAGQSVMSKIMVFLLFACCCSILALVVLVGASIYSQLPALQSGPTATAVGPGAAVVSIEHRAQRRHQQRSVLHRLAMLRRAQFPQKGIEVESVKLAFPHWVSGDSIDSSAALPDIILALSYLAQEDEVYRT
tara:strand:+ start:12074 stop:12553 length:480 start_codon:yes stop_codon:yes gene_type:complete